MAETLSSGLTLIIPSEGDSNWAASIKTNCFQKISEHDHTGSGKGLQIATNALSNLAVTEAKLAANAVTTAKILDANVTLAKLVTAVQESLVPSGSIIPTGRSSAPAGYLLCDGAAVSRATYSDLFAAISTGYGIGDGVTTFNLPNLQGRFLLGKATSGTGSTLGATGGAIDHTHSTPAHYHGMGTGATLSVDIDHNHAAFNSASDGAHNHKTETSGSFLGNSGSGGSANITTGGGGYSISNFSSIDGAHTHSIDVPALGATPKTPTGLVGLVTGGVDGNAAMISGTSNPPFQVVNYIIKI